MAETGQRLPEPHAPKVLLRFSLYLLYFLYVGVPLLLSGIAVYAASRHRWGEALMFVVFSAGEAVLGWKRLHGQWTWAGTGAVPELRRRLKE